MQIKLAPGVQDGRCAPSGPLSVDEFLARFPEVPRNLHDEPVLIRYVETFGPLLRLARKPTPCMGKDGGDAEHVFYVRLINDLAIYGMGLGRRERTLARLQALLDEQKKAPATFACSLVPHRPRGTPRAGCA